MKSIPKSYFKIPYIQIENWEFDDTINVITKEYAQQHNVIPMQLDQNVLTVCMGRPTTPLYRDLQKITGHFITVCKGCPKEIENQIKQNYK